MLSNLEFIFDPLNKENMPNTFFEITDNRTTEQKLKDALECISILNQKIKDNQVKAEARETELINLWAEKVKGLIELYKAQEEYIAFLSDKHSDAAPFLHVHGWHHSKEEIEKGIELRAKIELYKESKKP